MRLRAFIWICLLLVLPTCLVASADTMRLGETVYVFAQEGQAEPNLRVTVRGEGLDAAALTAVDTGRLSGAVFGVYARDAQGEYVPLPDPNDPARALLLEARDGVATATLPLSIDLYLRQETAPDGYTLDAAAQVYRPLSLPETIAYTNRQAGMQGLLLTVEADGAPLVGVRLTLLGQGLSQAMETDAQGRAVWIGLPPGDYVLRQDTTPDGYATDAAETPVIIAENELVSLTIQNSRDATLRLRALGLALDGNRTPRLVPIDRQYNVYTIDGTRVAANVLSGTALSLPATQAGSTYLVRAAGTADDGYAADPETYEVTLTSGASMTLETVARSEKGLFTLAHIDVETGAPVAGGTFVIYDAQGTAVLHLEADAQGAYAAETPLPAGAYTLRMDSAADGYLYADAAIPFQIEPYFSEGNPVMAVTATSRRVPASLSSPMVTATAQSLPSLFDADAEIDFTFSAFASEPALPVSGLTYTFDLPGLAGLTALETRPDGARVSIARRLPLDGVTEIDRLEISGTVSYTYTIPTGANGQTREAAVSAPFTVTVATFSPAAPRRYAIQGHLTDEAGTAIAGIPAMLEDASGGEIARTVTDPFGAYAFETMPAGAAIRFALPDGYGARAREGGATVLPLVTVRGRAIVYGGLGGYPVTLTIGDAPATRPDADGAFAITTTLSADDMFHAEVEDGLLVLIEEGQDGLLVHVLPAGEIRGVAVDPSSAPVADLQVTLTIPGVDGEDILLTDAQGAYAFGGLLPGEYVLSFEAPAGYLLTGEAGLSLTLGIGEVVGHADVGAMLPATITGVLLDGDRPFAGVEIALLPAGEVAVTDADGAFVFEGLALGEYTLAPNLPEDAAALDLPEAITIDASGQQSAHTIHAVRLATLAGRVWDDANDDGYVTADEGGVAGARIALLDANDVVVAEGETGADGAFAFGGLMPGEYRVAVSLPEGMIFSRSAPDTERLIVDINAREGVSAAYALASGQRLTSLVCGAVEAGSVSGALWHDLDGDGLRTGGEPALAGVAVSLLRADGTALEAVTDAQGAYHFDSLRPGNYTLALRLPGGHMFTRQSADSDVPETDAAYAEVSVTLRRWRMDQTINAGAQRAGSIAAHVWLDETASGMNPGDAGYTGLVVTLYQGSSVAAQAETDAAGDVAFAGLRPGTYRLGYAMPQAAGWGFTAGIAEGGTTGYSAAIAIGDGEDARAADVGITRLGTISGLVFEDANYDGLRGQGERGVVATVSLLDAKDDILRTVQAALGGAYAFDGLKTGVYKVRITVDDAYAFTKNRNDAPSYNSDVPETTATAAQTDLLFLPPGEALYADAGVYRRASVEGTLWHDTQADGRRGADSPPLAGIPVALLSGGEEIASTQTSADGGFAFGDLPPGEYALRVALPASMRFSPSGRLAAAEDTVGETTPFTLTGGARETGLDLGAVYTGGVAGVAYDARQGAGLAGVTVTLRRGGAVVATAHTGEDGGYRMDDLLPGEGELHYTLPEGWILDESMAAWQGVTIPQGDVAGAADMACLPEAVVEGLLWLDGDGDGVMAPDEAPLLGVGVALHREIDGEMGEDPVASAETGADGAFRFGQLPPGIYRLILRPTSGLLLYDGDEIGPFLLDVGERRTVEAAGYLGATISGMVWEDLDNDGLYSRGEPLLAGVPVALNAADGRLLKEVETDEDGRYRFDGVPPVSCAVVFRLPGEYIFTAQAEGGSVVPQVDMAEAATASIAVAMGEAIDGISAGALRHTRVGDIVWLDQNGNGLQDTGEPGVAGIVVRLLRVAADGAESLVGRTVTDAQGRYRFDGVRPGTYRAAFDIGSEFLPTKPLDTLDQINSKLPWTDGVTVTTAPFVAQSGRHNLTIDAGLVTREMAETLGWVIGDDGGVGEK